MRVTQQLHKRKRGMAPASLHQTNQLDCKPELHSEGERSLSSRVLSQMAAKRFGLEMSEGMENALRTRRRESEIYKLEPSVGVVEERVASFCL